MTTAYERLLDDLRNNGLTVIEAGTTAKAQCPAHDDTNPSLTITAIEDRVLIYCHARCTNEAIMTSLGRTMADLFDNKRGADYLYCDGRNVHRDAGKKFRQSGNTKGTALFHVDKIGGATTVHVVEGEQDVLAIEAADGVAVCSAMGAGKADLFDWTPLAGKNVVVVADKDEPGHKHAADVAAILANIAATITIVEAAAGKDAADHIAAGHTLDDFVHQPIAATPEPIDGAALLDKVHDTVTSYVAFANKHQPVAVTLWTAATHGIPAWQHATRLIIGSPQKRCGKSRLMDITGGLSFSTMLCSDATTAAIFRSIGKDDNYIPTLMVDEADALWGTKRAAESNEDLRALFNAGWQRNRPAKRCVGPMQIPTDFNTFAMVEFAAIGRLPDTITDRAVNIDLRRRAPGEEVKRFRIRRDGPKLTELRDKLTAWVRDPNLLAALADAEPTMPAGIEDRAADAWEPLIAIADAAGGHWPAKARAACRALSQSAEDAEDDLGIVLLRDIQAVFATAATKFMASQMLVNELRKIEESPWGDIELTVSKLAKRLKPFGVRPGHNAAKTARGYSLDSFMDSFRRYLRPKASSRPGKDTDQQENAENSEPSKSSATRPDRPNPDTSDDYRTTWTTTEKDGITTGQRDGSDGWTGLDGYPARNGTPDDSDYRRPGCVCIGQPRPCDYCQMAVSKQ